MCIRDSISTGWDTALRTSELERRLHLHAPTSSRIESDERLVIETQILLPKVRTKICVSFSLLAGVSAAVVGTKGEGMEVGVTVQPEARVVYGEGYGEEKMGRFLSERIGMAEDGRGCSLKGWDRAVGELREKLVLQGVKGGRK